MDPEVNPHPLAGGFTDDEKASLLQLREAMDRVLLLLEQQGGRTGTETDCINVAQGYLDITQCVGWLFHINVNPNDDAGETLLAGPRSGVVSKAAFELNRAKYELGKASGAFGNDPLFIAAIDALNSVDTYLPYATPFPDIYPKQFGPHGDYSKAQKALWGFSQYGVDAMKAWLRGMLAGELPECPNLFRDLARGFRRGQVHAWFMSAHVIDPTSEFSAFMTPFVAGLPDDNIAKRALVEIALISGINGEQGAAYAMRIAGASVGAALAPTMPNFAMFLLRYSDSWETGADDWNGHFEKIQ